VSRSIRKRSIAVIGLLAALGAGCAAEQPPHCDAFLKCFYSDEGVTSPDTIDGRTEFQDLSVKEDAEAALGENGECWANGAEDPLYSTCKETCEEIVGEECRQASLGSDRPCVEERGGQLVFFAEGMTEPLDCP
jgi:hypothetical protein